MLPKELIRFSTQHRAFYCYMILSVWIFLLIAGMYKYIGQNSNLLNTKIQQKLLLADFQAVASHWSNSENLLTYHKHCTPLTSIQRLNDGGLLEGWTLQGVLLILRHGDRGPMSHVRTISALNCGVIEEDYLVNKYRSFLFNATSTFGSNRMYWNKMGAFHGLPLLPLSEKECLLGQLTYKGLAQLLHLGEILHHIYALPLGLWLKRTTNQLGKSSINSTSYAQLFSSDEVVVYTTRVRRTFQSSMAFLYTFLPPYKWLSLNIKESHSIAFCFSDCACPQADVIRRNLFGLQKQQLLHDSLVIKIMQWIGYNLLPYKTNDIASDTHEIVDAILMILCHKAEWPCRSFNNSEEGVTASKANDLKLMDIINIDQDDLAMKNIIDINDEEKEQAIRKTQELKQKATLGCIEANQIAALLSFATRQSMQQAHHPFYKSLGLLRAYGMIRHIVSYMLRMISGDRTKFVLYSGHDWTLQYLTAALGIQTDTTFIPYATRLAIEVYKSETHVDFYFRIVYNGRDVTEQIDFCAGGKSLRVTRDSHGNKADLCPIENIIRFLHEDYFASLNATNFKDACLMPPKFNEF